MKLISKPYHSDNLLVSKSVEEVMALVGLSASEAQEHFEQEHIEDFLRDLESGIWMLKATAPSGTFSECDLTVLEEFVFNMAPQKSKS